MGRYEIQVLDCYDNPTYADGTTGAIYGQYPPLANACRKPGEWNVYDIIWEAPRFDGDTLVRPGYVTVILNGIVLHHHRELRGVTSHRVVTEYEPHGAEGPLELQDHGDLVRFRTSGTGRWWATTRIDRTANRLSACGRGSGRWRDRRCPAHCISPCGW